MGRGVRAPGNTLPSQRDGAPSVSRVARRSFEASTEEGRAFLQSRISTFARVMTLLMAGYFGFVLVARVTLGELRAGHDYVGVALAATALAGLGGMWLYTRKTVRSERMVQWLDLACAVDPSALIAFSVYMLRDLAIAPFAGFVGVSMMIFGRALIVPSTPRRTALASGLATAPLIVVVTLLSVWHGDMSVLPAPLLVGVIVAWSTIAVILTAYGSGVIYGLREQVREARQLGQYTLIEKIGEGGMGTVYRAQHAMLRRPTAIKLLPPNKSSEQHLQRFEREVQHTAELTHPNTVHIYDYGRSPDGVFYYAMEYLDGIDLDDLVERFGAQPAARVVHILRQLCGSLAEAHDHGLVHRDVKPANIYLCRRGGIPDVVKVLDFGLVKELERDGAALTDMNVVAGTPAFLAPEAITAPEKVGPASDLYAVGAVGYFLLTGAHVFTGATVVEVCSHHVHSQPAPPSARLGRALPSGLERLILDCLAKQPDDRPASARAILDALDELPERDGWRIADAEAWWADAEGNLASGPRERLLGVASTMQVDLSERANV